MGVVTTMGIISEPPEILGAAVGAALVGTFLGVLLALRNGWSFRAGSQIRRRRRMRLLLVRKNLLFGRCTGLCTEPIFRVRSKNPT